MKRGEIWMVSGGTDYSGKPRPAVIVQDDEFDATCSITICIFTTNPAEAPLFRVRIEPNERNGLRTASSLMVDKLTTVPKEKLGSRVGRVDDEDIVRLNQAMLVFLGLARSARTALRAAPAIRDERRQQYEARDERDRARKSQGQKRSLGV